MEVPVHAHAFPSTGQMEFLSMKKNGKESVMHVNYASRHKSEQRLGCPLACCHVLPILFHTLRGTKKRVKTTVVNEGLTPENFRSAIYSKARVSVSESFCRELERRDL